VFYDHHQHLSSTFVNIYHHLFLSTFLAQTNSHKNSFLCFRMSTRFGRGRGREGKSKSRRSSADKMAEAMATHMANVVPNMIAQIQALQQPPIVPQPALVPQQPQGGEVHAPRYTYKTFTSANPPHFNGTEGATALLQWFEGVENAFTNSQCPENLKTRFGMSALRKTALTWWNNEKRTRGEEAALALTWAEAKALITNKFCPRSEMRNLEDEFWTLKQDSGENLAYVTRFHELCKLLPHMVENEARTIEKFARGLPASIQDSIYAYRPTSLDEAISLSSTLTDNHVKDGTLFRKSGKGSKKGDKASSSKNKDKSKGKEKVDESGEKVKSDEGKKGGKRKRSHHDDKKGENAKKFALVKIPQQQQMNPVMAYGVPNANPNVQANPPYWTKFPLCDTCKRHHPREAECRYCTACNRFGHLMVQCFFNGMHSNQSNMQATGRNRMQGPNQGAPIGNVNTMGNRQNACHYCGDTSHRVAHCPRILQLERLATQVPALNAPPRLERKHLNYQPHLHKHHKQIQHLKPVKVVVAEPST
jgi:hypothetical protein